MFTSVEVGSNASAGERPGVTVVGADAPTGATTALATVGTSTTSAVRPSAVDSPFDLRRRASTQPTNSAATTNPAAITRIGPTELELFDVEIVGVVGFAGTVVADSGVARVMATVHAPR